MKRPELGTVGGKISLTDQTREVYSPCYNLKRVQGLQNGKRNAPYTLWLSEGFAHVVSCGSAEILDEKTTQPRRTRGKHK